MTAVLGIDAAWTAREPSGVAVVRRDAGNWKCVAVAPSYRSFLALAGGDAVDWQQRAFVGTLPEVPELLAAARSLAGRPIDLVTVDMPVATVPIQARRAADNAVSKEFGGRWCAAHTPSVRRPGPLGVALTAAFQAAGYPVRTVADRGAQGPGLLEVYPHPALLSLLRRPRRVPYKVAKSNRYWPSTSVNERIQNLLHEFHAIHSGLHRVLGPVPVPLPTPSSVFSLSSLKRYEDALDALVCAWVGIEHMAGRSVPLGDATAAIWCPADVVATAQVPAASSSRPSPDLPCP